MGAFFDSIHIRCESTETVSEILCKAAKGRFSYIITTPSEGWITIFLDDNGLSTDENDSICLGLSSCCCNSLVLKIKEHDSDVFYYTCFF
jgi:hypothetical protein